ncbi:MAG: ABC transporter permease [Alphaproteobacteria bacterium]|nr:ABC transporter permease [Alphaproteobacteria bacterium]
MAGRLARIADSDLWWSFSRSPVTIASALVVLVFFAIAILAPWLAGQNPFDPGALDIMDARIPPLWLADGQARFPLGTDSQGRDVLSTILYGARISLGVSIAANAVAMTLGVTLGLIAGYFGGRVDNVIMRFADVQLSFPTILIALLIDGLARQAMPRDVHATLAIPLVVFAIALANWVQYARTVRGSTMVEKSKEYVQAARVIGVGAPYILFRHVLPNVLGPVLVIATLGFGSAILTEAALSFLGLGVPATHPSLGTLIRIGNEVLFSGEWWITVFPAVALVLLVLAVNLLGDWLRDALNPKLR